MRPLSPAGVGDDDDLPLFEGEDDPRATAAAADAAMTPESGRGVWKILVADDDPQLHAVTRMVLAGVTFRGLPIRVEVAASARAAVETLSRSPDIALVLLDVVMETDDAGLGAVRAIREDLGNQDVRIVLRTGQPGLAPERDVVLRHAIDGYEAKDTLSAQKLLTVVISALRAFDHIRALQAQRRGLEQVIDATTSILRARHLEDFAAGVLAQLEGLIGRGLGPASPVEDGIFCAHLPREDATDVTAATILAGSGAFAGWRGESLTALPNGDRIAEVLAEAVARRGRVSFSTSPRGLAVALLTDHGRVALAWVGTALEPDPQAMELVRRFAVQLSAAWDLLADLSPPAPASPSGRHTEP